MNCRNILPVFITLVLLIQALLSNGQVPQKCVTVQLIEQYENKYPGTKSRIAAANQEALDWVKNHPEQPRSVITIPVVVHVVYHTPAQNISDEQIKSQIDVINEDFNRQNADTVNTPEPFKPVAGSLSVQFCLAAYDPNGDSTSGITRTYTNVTAFSTGDSLHFTSLGGEDAWPTDEYLNMWVANLDGNILGWGTLPGMADSQTDGVVVLYKAFGREGNAQYPYDLGRTCTHEVGHWLGMYHVWGDDQGACTGTDYMDDTPNQADWTFGNPSFPVTDICSPNYPGIMFMNYMDYTDDRAMNIFTQDQVAKMNAVLNDPSQRRSIQFSPAGCQGVHFTNDAATIKILVPADTLDAESFQPQIQIANRGSNNLTSLTVYYQADGQEPGVYQFTGNLSTNQSAIIIAPLYFTGEGDHTFTSWCSQPNNSTDEYIYNDSTSGDFTVVSTVPKNTVDIWPNPTSGDISISLKNPAAGEMDLRVVNVLGQVMQHHFIGVETQSSLSVDLSDLSNGIYFLYIKIGYDYLTRKIMVWK